MSSPIPARAPSSPATPSRAPNHPGSASATPTFSTQTPRQLLSASSSPSVNRQTPHQLLSASSSPSVNRQTPRQLLSVSSSPSANNTTPPKYSNGLGLDDDHDDDLISTVGGGVYIDHDVNTDKQGNVSHTETEWGGNVTEFSELDSDMSLFASLKSGGGVSVAGGIIEEHEEGEESKGSGAEILEKEAAMSPAMSLAQPFGGSIGSVEVDNRPHTPIRSPMAGSPTYRITPVTRQGHSRASSRSSVFSVISPSSPGRHAANPSVRPFQDRDQTTQLLIEDFTAQFNAVNHPPQPHTPSHRSLHYNHPSSRGSVNGLFSPQPSKSRSETAGAPSRRSSVGTPDSNSRLLIDFDFPPPPSPRSIPTITLREVEKLKSEFLIQLGELKAQLSGRDAEVLNLRESLREAEGRCGNLREEVETLEHGKAEAEGMLTKFREQAQAQFEDAQREWDEERGGLMKEADEARGRLEEEVETTKARFVEIERMMGEALEGKEKLMQELEAAKKEIEAIRIGTSAPARTPADPPGVCANCAAGGSGGGSAGGGGGGGASKEEVDRIAKELHILYKQKHETKVAALKKSYEQRWEKKVMALESEIEGLKAIPPLSEPATSDTSLGETKEKVDNLSQAVEELKKENSTLKGHVERERREKGELVAAVEEMLALQIQTLNEAADAAAAEEEEKEKEARKAASQKPSSRAQAQSSSGPGESRPKGGLAKPGTLKLKDVKRLEKGWEGVKRRASGIGVGPLIAETPSASSASGISGIPRAPGIGTAAGTSRGNAERIGRGAGSRGNR